MKEFERDRSVRPNHDVVTTTISVDQLDSYRQAATQTGYIIEVLATEGGSFTTWRLTPTESYRENIVRSEWTETLIKVDSGRMGLGIKRGPDHQDYGPFWTALRSIDVSSKEPKS